MPRPIALHARHLSVDGPPVAEILRAQGMDVRITSSLPETLQRLPEERPELILLEPLSGALDGLEVRAVRRAAPPHAVLMVLLPAEAAAIPRPSRMPEGVDDFLVAPFPAEEVAARLALGRDRRRRERQLEETAEQLARDSLTDFKTGLFNDRYFFRRLDEEQQRAARHGQVLSLVVLDLDDFKAINDDHDHLFGDRVLEHFARKLRAITRQIDIAARLGGDEFALLLPNTDLQEASALATRLHDTLAAEDVRHQGRTCRLQVSIGIHSARGEAIGDPQAFYQVADRTLLEAKRRGKNRILLSVELDGSAAAAGA